MTKTQATREAQAIADTDRLDMAVLFNPYEEVESDENKYGYCPAGSAHILKFEEVVETLKPQ